MLVPEPRMTRGRCLEAGEVRSVTDLEEADTTGYR
jgi:hypothetical protein